AGIPAERPASTAGPERGRSRAQRSARCRNAGSVTPDGARIARSSRGVWGAATGATVAESPFHGVRERQTDMVALHAARGEHNMGDAHVATGEAGPSRWRVVITATALVVGGRLPATAGNAELCRQLTLECTEARAAGYHDVGICHVERVECPTDDDAPAPKR